MILDTNAVSAIADGDPAIGTLLRRADRIAIPVIALGEYKYGISQSRFRLRYERWLRELLLTCRVLDADSETATRYADIRRELKAIGRPIPGNDLWIAALARQHALPLLSRDSHFDFVLGLDRMNW